MSFLRSASRVAFGACLAAGITGLAAGITGLAAGCAEGGTQSVVIETAPTTPAELRAQGWESTLARIANATCDREQSCGTIGPGAFFKSREECFALFRERTAKGVNQGACPGGISSAGLRQCLASLDASECSQPGDAITRSAKCDAADLCVR
jgi:hypothetical protein